MGGVVTAMRRRVVPPRVMGLDDNVATGAPPRLPTVSRRTTRLALCTIAPPRSWFVEIVPCGRRRTTPRCGTWRSSTRRMAWRVAPWTPSVARWTVASPGSQVRVRPHPSTSTPSPLLVIAPHIAVLASASLTRRPRGTTLSPHVLAARCDPAVVASQPWTSPWLRSLSLTHARLLMYIWRRCGVVLSDAVAAAAYSFLRLPQSSIAPLRLTTLTTTNRAGGQVRL